MGATLTRARKLAELRRQLDAVRARRVAAEAHLDAVRRDTAARMAELDAELDRARRGTAEQATRAAADAATGAGGTAADAARARAVLDAAASAADARAPRDAAAPVYRELERRLAQHAAGPADQTKAAGAPEHAPEDVKRR